MGVGGNDACVRETQKDIVGPSPSTISPPPGGSSGADAHKQWQQRLNLAPVSLGLLSELRAGTVARDRCDGGTIETGGPRALARPRRVMFVLRLRLSRALLSCCVGVDDVSRADLAQ